FVRYQRQREFSFPQTLDQAHLPMGIVRMPVAQHNGMQLFWLHLQHVHVLQEPIFAQSRVEEEGFRGIPTGDSDERGKAVLGYEARARESIWREGEAFGLLRAGHEEINGIIEDREDLSL